MVTRDRRTLFDEWAKDYDSSVHARADFPFVGYADVLAEVERKAQAVRGHSVLDVGIGTGNLAERFLNAGCAVWGVDFSQEMLDRAQGRFPALRLVRADLGAELTRLDRRFDRIVSAYVLHELPLPVKVRHIRGLAETHLVAGGMMVLGDIAFPSREIREAAARKWSEQWDPEEHYWAADETLEALSGAGLSVSYGQVSSCAGVFTIQAISGPGAG